MPSYSKTTTLKRVQFDPPASGAVLAQAFFEEKLVNDADETDSVTKPWNMVSFTLPTELVAQIEALATTSQE